MIIIFEGTPGSGKSYDAVQKIIDNLRKGRIVYTNMEGMELPQQQEHIKAQCQLGDWEFSQQFFFLDGADLLEFWKVVKKGSLIVIDEAHKLYNSRDWQKQINRDCANWCSTHRHGGYDVVFITQAVEKLDAQIRTLVEFTYRYRKINFFGSLVTNSYLVYPFAGDDTGKAMASPFKRMYRKQIFDCYKSYVTADVKELGIMSHINILKHPVFYLIPCVLIAFIYFFSQSSFADGRLFPVPRVSAVVPVVPADVVLPSVVAVGAPRTQKKGSATSKVLGRADGLKNTYFVLLMPGSDDPVTLGSYEVDELCRCNSKARLNVGDLILL